MDLEQDIHRKCFNIHKDMATYNPIGLNKAWQDAFQPGKDFST
jgi:hypothetical protein